MILIFKYIKKSKSRERKILTDLLVLFSLSYVNLYGCLHGCESGRKKGILFRGNLSLCHVLSHNP